MQENEFLKSLSKKFYFLEFRFTEKLVSYLLLTPSQFPLVLTSSISVAHLLQLMNKYWYIIVNKNS